MEASYQSTKYTDEKYAGDPLTRTQIIYILLIVILGVFIGWLGSDWVLKVTDSSIVIIHAITVTALLMIYSASINQSEILKNGVYTYFTIFIIILAISNIVGLLLSIGIYLSFFGCETFFRCIVTGGVLSGLIIVAERGLNLFTGVLFFRRLLVPSS